MLREIQLFEIVDKVEQSIQRLKDHEPEDGYFLAFSGGKDSIVIKQLAIEAGVKFDAHYTVTTIDPPDLIHYIKKYHSEVIWDRPQKPFLSMVIQKGFPLRQSRWCCDVYKEQGGDGRVVVTGVRWEESAKRRLRKMYEESRNKKKWFLHPIIDWASDELWAFIRDRNLPYCKLYDEGWKRVGCLFCPFDSHYNKKREVEKYPVFAKAFTRAFQRLKDDRKSKGSPSCDRWKDGKEMFDWYITGKGGKEEIGLFD